MDNVEFIHYTAGNAIRLSTVYYVSGVMRSEYKNEPRLDGCYFTITYGPRGDTAQFYYRYSNYTEDRDTLFKKIENTRMNILKLMNNGVEVKPVNSAIKLKKKDG